MRRKGQFSIGTPQCLSPVQSLAIGFLLIVLLVAGQHELTYSLHYDEIMQMSSSQLADIVDAGSIVRRIAFVALLVGGALMLVIVRKGGSHWNGLRNNVPLVCFVGFAFLSALWSSDPGITFRRSSEYLILCIGAAAAGRFLGLRGVIRLGFLGSTGYLLIGLISEVVLGTFHPFTFDYRFCGTLHPNHQAWNCVLLLISGSALLPQVRRSWRIAYLMAMALGGVCLFLTKSRTSLVCGALALVFYWAGPAPGKQKLRLAFVSGTVLVGVLFVAMFVNSRVATQLDRTLLAGRDEDTYQNFSGRIPLWELCMEYVGVRPLLGYGFESFWTADHIQDVSAEEGWTVPISHNGFIELMLGLGVIGLSLYLYQLADTWRLLRRSYRATRDPFVRFCLALLVFYFTCTFLEAIAFDVGLPTFCLLSILWSRKQFAPWPPQGMVRTPRPIQASFPRLGSVLGLMRVS
jgi:exopolysaccharide production protein ExoQ